MKLSEQAIKDFQKVYKEVFGIDIEYEMAKEEAEVLMRLMYIVLQKRLKKR